MPPQNRFLTRHPFDFIPPGWWPRFFWLLLGLTIVLMTVFGITGAPLTTDAAPYGVVSFELAGTVEKANQILDSWDVEAQLRAAFGLGLDYVFMLAYASTIAFGCGMAARMLQDNSWPLARWGGLLSWAVILAAFLDILENIALASIIFGSVASPWPQIARWCAIPKFVLVFMGIVYVIYGGIVALVERISPDQKE
jgi:hypothetical protein